MTVHVEFTPNPIHGSTSLTSRLSELCPGQMVSQFDFSPDASRFMVISAGLRGDAQVEEYYQNDAIQQIILGQVSPDDVKPDLVTPIITGGRFMTDFGVECTDPDGAASIISSNYPRNHPFTLAATILQGTLSVYNVFDSQVRPFEHPQVTSRYTRSNSWHYFMGMMGFRPPIS